VIDLEPVQARGLGSSTIAWALGHIHCHRPTHVWPLTPLGLDATSSRNRSCNLPWGSGTVASDELGIEIADGMKLLPFMLNSRTTWRGG